MIARQVLLDFGDLCSDEVRVVEDPLRRGRKGVVEPGGFHEVAAGGFEGIPVFAQAVDDGPSGLPRNRGTWRFAVFPDIGNRVLIGARSGTKARPHDEDSRRTFQTQGLDCVFDSGGVNLDDDQRLAFEA